MTMSGLANVFLLIFLTIEFNENIRVYGKSTLNRDENVGTVLFERNDREKDCWTREEFVALNTRRMFQRILPKADRIDWENDRYVGSLLDYFRVSLECVRKFTIGKTKRLMLKSLADTMGGYLRVNVLPPTRRSYYSGNIDYRNALRLFDLFDELKIFLRTNGIGWFEPNREFKRANAPPIVVTPPNTVTSCDGLILRQDRDTWRNSESITIPLPFLDDEVTPNSVAMPFKTEHLRSLYDEKSAFTLVKYYIASAKCIASRSRTNRQLDKFNDNVYDWLQRSVIPHLDDEKWYPAFGGVLRIISTLGDTRTRSKNAGIELKKGGDYQMMPKMSLAQKSYQKNEEVITVDNPDSPAREEDGNVTFGTTELVVIAVCGALLVWILMGLSFICYRFLVANSEKRRTRGSPSDRPSEAANEKATSHQKRSENQISGQKFRRWWRNKFRSCPGRCNDEADEERCLAAMSYNSNDTIDVTNSSRTSSKRASKFSKSASPSPTTTPGRGASSGSRHGYSSDSSSGTEVERVGLR